ncbi:MAG: hypothetical protein CSB44_05005 [Gammaproteobacteria bacterium]|nr:MAG: hypothetical protein CSB44_05005 [Gammaproteobacteria bacterium]
MTLLLVSLVLASLPLYLSGTFAGVERTSLAHIEDSRHRLVAARRRITAHSLHYPWSYGHRGAGAGHFPCPDTGRLEGVFGGDGPDPPCAGVGTVAGRLPRHVSLPGRRIAFHREDEQRIGYRLQSTHVNNPLGRVVNLQSPPEGEVRLPILELELQGTTIVVDDARYRERLAGVVSVWLSETLALASRSFDAGEERRCLLALLSGDLPCSATGEPLRSDARWQAPTEMQPGLVDLFGQGFAKRHWYWRNHWPSQVMVVLHDACADKPWLRPANAETASSVEASFNTEASFKTEAAFNTEAALNTEASFEKTVMPEEAAPDPAGRRARNAATVCVVEPQGITFKNGKLSLVIRPVQHQQSSLTEAGRESG